MQLRQESRVTRALRATVLRRAVSSWLRRREAARAMQLRQLNPRLVLQHCQDQRHGLRPSSAKLTAYALLVSVALGLYKVIMSSISAHRLLSNLTLNRTANGMAPWPRSALVHHAPHGQGTMPSSAG